MGRRWPPLQLSTVSAESQGMDPILPFIQHPLSGSLLSVAAVNDTSQVPVPLVILGREETELHLDGGVLVGCQVGWRRGERPPSRGTAGTGRSGVACVTPHWGVTGSVAHLGQG